MKGEYLSIETLEKIARLEKIIKEINEYADKHKQDTTITLSIESTLEGDRVVSYNRGLLDILKIINKEEENEGNRLTK